MPDKLPLNKKSGGQALVETVVALGIILFGVIGVFALVSRSLSLNRVMADRYTAVNLAAEGVEIVKNLIDRNVIQRRPWNEGLSAGRYEIDFNDSAVQSAGDRPLLLNTDNLYQYDVGQPTVFQRAIAIEWLSGGEEMRVNSRVKWISRGGGEFSVDLEDHFYNWR
jgi:hypothetical protein